MTFTRFSPGQRTPKDKIRLKDRPQTVDTHARGLVSGQSMLTKRQAENEAEIMSVALNQPHRIGIPYFQTDSDYWVSELGNFVRKHHSAGDLKTYRESVAFLRYRAGTEFAIVIDNDLVASGLIPREFGEGEYTGELDESALRARRTVCSNRRREAEDVIRDQDKRGALPMAVWACTRLCHEGSAIPEHLHQVVVDCLYKLSLLFEIEKPGYHDGK